MSMHVHAWITVWFIMETKHYLTHSYVRGSGDR